jgi:hypothetical protein
MNIKVYMYKKSNNITFYVNYAGIFCEDGNSEKISWPYLRIKLYIQDFEAVAKILLKIKIAYDVKLYVWVNNSASLHVSWCFHLQFQEPN